MHHLLRHEAMHCRSVDVYLCHHELIRLASATPVQAGLAAIGGGLPLPVLAPFAAMAAARRPQRLQPTSITPDASAAGFIGSNPRMGSPVS